MILVSSYSTVVSAPLIRLGGIAQVISSDFEHFLTSWIDGYCNISKLLLLFSLFLSPGELSWSSWYMSNCIVLVISTAFCRLNIALRLFWTARLFNLDFLSDCFGLGTSRLFCWDFLSLLDSEISSSDFYSPLLDSSILSLSSLSLSLSIYSVYFYLYNRCLGWRNCRLRYDKIWSLLVLFVRLES